MNFHYTEFFSDYEHLKYMKEITETIDFNECLLTIEFCDHPAKRLNYALYWTQAPKQLGDL